MCNLWCLSYFSLQGKCFPGGVRGTVSAAGKRGRERRRQGGAAGRVCPRGIFWRQRGAAAGKALRGRGGSVRRASRGICGRGSCLRGGGAFAGRGFLDRQAREGEGGRTGLRGEKILRRGQKSHRRGGIFCVRVGRLRGGGSFVEGKRRRAEDFFAGGACLPAGDFFAAERRGPSLRGLVRGRLVCRAGARRLLAGEASVGPLPKERPGARDYFFSGLLPRTIMSAKAVAVSFTQSR